MTGVRNAEGRSVITRCGDCDLLTTDSAQVISSLTDDTTSVGGRHQVALLLPDLLGMSCMSVGDRTTSGFPLSDRTPSITTIRMNRDPRGIDPCNQ